MPKKNIIFILCLLIFATCSKKTDVMAVTLYTYRESDEEDSTNDILNGLIEENGYYYYYENGEKVVNKWIESEDGKYYFKKDGRAAVASYKIKGKYYIFNNQGQLMQPEVKKITSIEIDGKVKKYYVSPDGTALSGWTLDKSYYCYKSGEAATGIIVINGKFYCFSKSGKYNRQKTIKIRKAARYKKTFADLKKFIGNPDKAKYYPSCYGKGKDGILSYDNFIIFTFKPDKGKEIFMGAE